MSIRLKWIGLWLAFGFVMLAIFMSSHHYLLKSTILYYVDQRDHQRLDRLKTNLEVMFQRQQIISAEDLDPLIWQPLLRLSNRVDLSQTNQPFDLLLERFLRRPPPDTERRFNFERRVNLLDPENQLLLGNAPEKYDFLLPIKHNNQLVAQIGYVRSNDITEQTDIEFAKVQEDVLKIGALVILLTALLMLWPVNRQLIQPIRKLVTGLTQLSAGNYASRLTAVSHDEWGQLAQHFNHLAFTLENAQKSRSQWVADISHELRTPVTILRSSVESMQEGLRPVNEKTLAAVHEEVLLLNRLIDDLYQLSLHDIGALHYQMQSVDLAALVQKSLQAHRPLIERKGLVLHLSLTENLLPILADEKRLLQLLNNLILNALDYTDAIQSDGRPGEIHIKLVGDQAALTLEISDSAPGVNAEDMAHLSDYLYRAENSRNRRLGGAGLGLAICQKIANAHQASLDFAPSPWGGLSVSMRFPLFHNKTQEA